MNEEKFERIVKRFETAKSPDGHFLNLHYLLIKQNQTSYLHRFNERKELSDIRSISKTVMTLVTGIVIELSKQGKYPDFDENTEIFPIIADAIHVTNEDNVERLKRIKVKHLLNHTVGYDEVLLMRNDIAYKDAFTYLNYIINEPLKHEPGEHYLYSNAGFYLLSAVLQEFLQEDLLDFIHRNLFEPLQIKEYSFEKYGNYLAGATRLWMYPRDLLKIGELLLNKGMYQGVRLINPEWIGYMLTPTIYTEKVDTPNRTFRRYAYGSGIWLAKESIFFGHGTDGQTLTMIPQKNTIILTLASQKKVNELEEIINEIIEDEL